MSVPSAPVHRRRRLAAVPADGRRRGRIRGSSASSARSGGCSSTRPAAARRLARTSSSIARSARPTEFVGFVILGGAMTRVLAERPVGDGATSCSGRRRSGNLALYIMAPTSLMAILLGMALGGMVATTVARSRDPRDRAACCSTSTSPSRAGRCCGRCSC